MSCRYCSVQRHFDPGTSEPDLVLRCFSVDSERLHYHEENEYQSNGFLQVFTSDNDHLTSMIYIMGQNCNHDRQLRQRIRRDSICVLV